jgi:hypothetical protein
LRSIRKTLAVAAAVLCGGAVVAVTSAPAVHAATTDCGFNCEDWYNQGSGDADLISVDSGTAQTGLGTMVAAAGDYSAEDFEMGGQETVTTYYKAGVVNATVNAYWGSDYAFELQYAPDGQASDLCLGVASDAYSSEPVTLQPCGVDATTLWIELAADKSDGYQPLINASTVSYSEPEVLTVTVVMHGYPPVFTPVLELASLFEYDGAWSTSQMWGSQLGPAGT